MSGADWVGLATAIMAFISAIGAFIASWKAGQAVKAVNLQLHDVNLKLNKVTK